MAAPIRPFTLDRGRIRIDDRLLVYLERSVRPLQPLPPGTAPRSHGVAPIAGSGPGSVVASVAPSEAIWLGFQAVDRSRPVTVRVRLEGAKPIDAVTGGPWQDGLAEAPRSYLVCPPDTRLEGVQGADGYRPFGGRFSSPARHIVEELTVLAWTPTPTSVAVRMVRPATFKRLTGLVPEPLDPDSAYRGERLP